MWNSLLLRLCVRALLGLGAFGWFATTAPAQQLAITFDDLPAHSILPPGTTREQVAERIIQALHEAGVPSIYGFVNGQDLQQNPADAAVLQMWIRAGNVLGNHTWSHMDLNKVSLDAWEQDVLRNEPVLQAASENGDDWHWLRFPYLSEGNTPEKRAGARAFLGSRGYKIAGVTMSFGDYAWNEPYARCSAKGDAAAIAELEKTYLAAAAADIRYRRALAKATFGHDVPYVLLMHIGAMDARLLPRLLALYKSEGFTFITLQRAEQDPLYANEIDLKLPSDPNPLENAAKAKGISPWPTYTPIPAELSTLCR